MPPPLRKAHSLGHESQLRSIGRGSSPEFVVIPLARYFQWRATLRAHAKYIVQARNIVRARREIQPLPVMRPSVDQFGCFAVGEPPQFARRKGQHINIAIPGPVRRERQLRAIRRIQWPRLRCRMRNQQPGLSTFLRNRPNNPARHKRNLRMVRRNRRLSEGGQGSRETIG